MKAVLKTTGLKTFDAVVPNEIGGLNAFEAILAGHRFGKSALDTDLVARAYPMIYQTVRCLNKVSITPSALADGGGREEVRPTSCIAILNINTYLRYSRISSTVLLRKKLCGRQLSILVP